MKALSISFAVAAVIALLFCVTVIFLVRVFFWFASDIFKRHKINEDDIEDRWWQAIK